MRYFGEPWNPAMLAEPGLERVDPPVGAPCAQCATPIVAGDQGVLVPHMEMSPDGTWGLRADTPFHGRCFIVHMVGEADAVECWDGRGGVIVAGDETGPQTSL